VRRHPHPRDSLALYVLGALEPGQADEIERHVAECPECAEEAAQLRDTAAGLAHEVPRVAPPEALRERLLDRVRREPRKAARRIVASPRRDGRRSRRALRWVARIAVAAVIVALVGSLLHLRGQLYEALYLAGRSREVLEFLTSPEVRAISLEGRGFAAQARALLAHDRRTGRVLFLSLDLPPAPPGQAYQLWFIADGISPGGVFSAAVWGGTLVEDHWSARERPPLVFAVTLESEEGAAFPAGEIVLLSARHG
jgi:anti-sigma-K factor RskA